MKKTKPVHLRFMNQFSLVFEDLNYLNLNDEVYKKLIQNRKSSFCEMWKKIYWVVYIIFFISTCVILSYQYCGIKKSINKLNWTNPWFSLEKSIVLLYFIRYFKPHTKLQNQSELWFSLLNTKPVQFYGWVNMNWTMD